MSCKCTTTKVNCGMTVVVSAMHERGAEAVAGLIYLAGEHHRRDHIADVLCGRLIPLSPQPDRAAAALRATEGRGHAR